MSTPFLDFRCTHVHCGLGENVSVLKARCRGCGQEEYLLNREGLCETCQRCGPPWYRWLWLVAIAGVVALTLFR